MYNSAKSTNTENLIGNIIESSIFIDSTNNDVESLKLKVNDPYFETKYSVFQSQGKTTEIDLKNPSPEQVAKLELILELIQDKKLTEEQIKNSLKLIDTKPWMSGSEVKQLKPSDWILWNNIIQSGLTAPAIITTLIRCGCPYGILTNIAGFVVSGGGYMFLQNKSHELETNLYSGDSKSRIEDFRNRALQVVATGLISIIPSYVGGQNVNSVFFSPHQKIERIIVSDKNIEISTKKAQTIIDANKKELENDSSYKAILARVKQAESKIAQNNTELRDFDDKHKDDPKSDNVKLEKVRIKGLESAKSVLAGRTQRQFASNGILVDNQDFIELDKANQALAEYENSTTAGEQNSEYRKSKEKLNLLAKLRNEKENAWKQDDSEKLINEQVLRILAEDQGKSPEHLKELINGTLSTQEMDQLAEPYFTNKENGFTDNLAHLVILLDLIILGSRLYSLNKKQLVSNEDYQKGLEELGQNYGSKLSSLKFQRDIYDGEEIPEDPMDRSQDQKDLASSNGNKELILNKILNSREFLLAVQIVAAEGYGTLGVAMKEFQAEFKLSMNVKSVIGNQVNRFSSIKSAISSIANYPSTIFQKIQDSNLEKSEQKSEKQKK